MEIQYPLSFPNSGIRAKQTQREKGWLATARPPAGAASHGQATCRGGRPWLKPLAGVASPQGAADRDEVARGSPTARATTYKGGRWRCRPPARCRPRTATACAGAVEVA
ncbi:hypothetical protein GW17_00039698 [Ensete ventricosum]|nr:hypothetical protein GW17_00039698 [Ensete ventricosum]